MKLTEQKLKEMIVQELFGLFKGKRNAEDEIAGEQSNTADGGDSSNSEQDTPENTKSVQQLKAQLVALRAEIKEMERLLRSGKGKEGNKLGWSDRRAFKKEIKEKTKEQTEIYKKYRVAREKEKEEEIKAREAAQQQGADTTEQTSGEEGSNEPAETTQTNTSEQEEEARKNKEALQRVQDILANLANQIDKITT